MNLHQAVRIAKAAYLIRPHSNRLRIRRVDWDVHTFIVVMNDRDVIHNSCWPAGDDPIWRLVKMTHNIVNHTWAFDVRWEPDPSDLLSGWDAMNH